MVLIIVGASLVYSSNERMAQQAILFEAFRFDGSLSLVSGKSCYVGGGPQFHIDVGDTVEVSDIHPPAGFNGSLQNVYFAVWESPPQPGSSPNELIRADTLPVTHVAKSNYVFFQLVSIEPLQDLAQGSSWKGDFVYPYRIPENTGLLVSGILALTCGITTVVVAGYRLVNSIKPKHALPA